MQWLIVFSCVLISSVQILYECNFDNAIISNNCLSPVGIGGMLIDETMGIADSQPPTLPLSDVTSSLTPTSNGELCILPYNVNSYTWDITVPGYKIYFDFEKISGPATSPTVIAIDEISIRQGSCFGQQRVTQDTTNILTTSIASTTIDGETESTTVKTSTVSIKITTTIEQSTESSTISSDSSITSITSTTSSTALTTITTSTSDNQSTEFNNIYIIVLATVIPVVVVASIAITVWIKKFRPKEKILPSTLELNQVSRWPS
ncbi:unnamed protein product [Rotaria sordida]|uniref:Uncharacterized protein n=1 Tax=Rotaria sordida TaxID=392033 RepID=A0A813X1L9_9BILA|nr:unnamed protein product [Rotaria sordida]CAF0860356.1 unnamed protein product [Rotaria sordida]CAF0867196.1 unnamed protein product [Rotaria sordida]